MLDTFCFRLKRLLRVLTTFLRKYALRNSIDDELRIGPILNTRLGLYQWGDRIGPHEYQLFEGNTGPRSYSQREGPHGNHQVSPES